MKSKLTYSAMDVLLASPDTPTPADKRTHQLTRMWGGLNNLETAESPTEDDWMVCSDAVNLMETLIKMGLVEDSEGLIDDAIKALSEAANRTTQGKPMRLSGPGIQAVRGVLQDYSAVLEVLSHRQMVVAHRTTEATLQKILKNAVDPIHARLYSC